MDFARLVQQQRPGDADPFFGPGEQFGTRDQKISTGKCRQFLHRKGVRDRSNPRPVHLAYAHGARFTTRVEHAATNLIGRELSDRLCYQISLGVGCGITIRSGRVLRRQGDSAVDNEEGPNGWLPANLA
jgi:hypothetical protein